jgi:hypothetical protein
VQANEDDITIPTKPPKLGDQKAFHNELIATTSPFETVKAYIDKNYYPTICEEIKDSAGSPLFSLYYI